jgi:hypothetical protein
MTNPYGANPFEALRLDPAADDEQVVAHAGRLRQRATDETEVAAIRRAVQALTGRPEERWVHQLFTHPRPCYRWRSLERFVAAFGRPPAAPGEGRSDDPGPAAAGLDLRKLALLLDPGGSGTADIRVTEGSQTCPGRMPEDVRRQLGQALLACLRHDLGG